MIFFMDIIPPRATHQEKRSVVLNGKKIFYDPPKVKEARDLYMTALLPHRPNKPYEGAVRLETVWSFPRGRHKAGPKTTKPDCDNMIKLLKDCMTYAGFWKDDALVACEVTEKMWGDVPGIYVVVEEID